MTKGKIIKNAESLLEECGFTQHDFVISLQGPTLILAQSGRDKIEKDSTLKVNLMHIGIQII
jgi:hypothetical protein